MAHKNSLCTDLEDRLNVLEQRIADIEKSISTAKKNEADFIEYDGMLFKRNFNGMWANAVFCPNCKNSARVWTQQKMIVECKICNWSAPFPYRSINEILEKLPK